MVRKQGWSIAGLAVVMMSMVPQVAAAQGSGVGIVTQLYRDYAWEVVMDEPLPGGNALVLQPQATLAKYFDTELATLLANDAACAKKSQGICALEFPPLWMTQMTGVSELKIAATSDPAVVSVSFRQAGAKTATKLQVRVRRTPAGWRVQDIVYPEIGSLVKVLKENK